LPEDEIVSGQEGPPGEEEMKKTLMTLTLALAPLIFAQTNPPAQSSPAPSSSAATTAKPATAKTKKHSKTNKNTTAAPKSNSGTSAPASGSSK
jgi:hypothetical protein